MATVGVFFLLAAFVPPTHRFRNLTVALITVAVMVGPFLIRDRWGRNLWTRVLFWFRWRWHRSTGRTLWTGPWFSAVGVERSALPGLLAQSSIGEHRTILDGALLNYATITHPPSKTLGVVLACEPDGDATDETIRVESKRAGWQRWLTTMADEPGLISIQIVTETGPATTSDVEALVDAAVTTNGPAAELVREFTAATAGRLITRCWVAVHWKQSARLGPDVLPARIRRICEDLTNAGAGQVQPVTKNQLAQCWAAMFDPDRREDFAKHPNAEVSVGDTATVVVDEHRTRFCHGDWASTSVTMGQTPDGIPTTEVFDRLARGVEGAQTVRAAILLRPVPSVEARKWAAGIGRAINTRIGLRGEDAKTKIEDVAAVEDHTATTNALVRGTALTRVAFTATITTTANQDHRPVLEALQGALAPLSPHTRPMHGVQQTSWVATLPGGTPLPAALKPSEGLDQ